MWHSNSFLKECEQLSHAGYAPLLEKGMRIARGFADLGYEEFVMLTDYKIASLYSGSISTPPDEHRKFFFHVPSADELVQAIIKAGGDIIKVSFVNQREWQVETRSETGEQLCCNSEEITIALVRTLKTLKTAK